MNKINARIDDKIAKAEMGIEEPTNPSNNEQLID